MEGATRGLERARRRDHGIVEPPDHLRARSTAAAASRWSWPTSPLRTRIAVWPGSISRAENAGIPRRLTPARSRTRRRTASPAPVTRARARARTPCAKRCMRVQGASSGARNPVDRGPCAHRVRDRPADRARDLPDEQRADARRRRRTRPIRFGAISTPVRTSC